MLISEKLGVWLRVYLIGFEKRYRLAFISQIQ